MNENIFKFLPEYIIDCWQLKGLWEASQEQWTVLHNGVRVPKTTVRSYTIVNNAANVCSGVAISEGAELWRFDSTRIIMTIVGTNEEGTISHDGNKIIFDPFEQDSNKKLTLTRLSKFLIIFQIFTIILFTMKLQVLSTSNYFPSFCSSRCRI